MEKIEDRTKEDRDNDLSSYIITALWATQVEEEGEEFALDERYCITDMDEETLGQMNIELMDFINKHYYLVDKNDKETSMSYFVHNFWLTRNGHGAGFWDGGYKNGDRLSEITDQEYGSLSLYIGDDKLIYSTT